jgi:segregation and condensation protein B
MVEEHTQPAADTETDEPAATASAPAPDGTSDLDTPDLELEAIEVPAEPPSPSEADAGLAEAFDLETLPTVLEAMLFVADQPVAAASLARVLDLTPTQVRRGLDRLAESLRDGGRGVRLQQGPDGAQLVTAPDAAAVVEEFLGLEANRRLSSAALETLAIIAYRQPVTRQLIDQIRGVNSDGALATLRARGLIDGIGRAPGPGRAVLFSTTQRFLEHFGLEGADQLPALPEDLAPPPGDHGAQLALTDAVAAELAADDDQGAEPASDAPLAEDVASAAEVEISSDLGELSRAAEVALAGVEAAEDHPAG